MNKNILKVLSILVLVCTLGTLMVSCKKPHEHTFVEGKCECGETDPNYKPEETPALGDYKLGLGTVIGLDSSKTGTAQIDGTIAAVVLDKDGKIVLCRIDAIQNKIPVADGFIEMPSAFKTKMELGSDYGMAGSPWSSDNNGDGVIKEWFEQAKAFENYVVGKTVAEVEAIKTQTLENGYVIGTDDALLSAGCTIQITDFIAAVAKACKDDQAVSFQSAGNFTLGVAANSYNDGSKDADDDKDGAVQVYSDIAASVVEGGKIVASLNDAVQPKVSFNVAGEITKKDFKGTKRELKENYGMSTSPYSPDNNGDGTVKEWYVQSAAFSAHVVGKTAAEVEALATKTLENGYVISSDDALLGAGCTIQITGIKAVVAKSVSNAR
jgi:hypothetical protein